MPMAFRVVPVLETLGIMGGALASGGHPPRCQAIGLLQEVVFAVEAIPAGILAFGLQATGPDYPIPVVVPQCLTLAQVSFFVSVF